MSTHDDLPSHDRRRTNVYVRKSRALARLTQLTWKKRLLPLLKDYLVKSQGLGIQEKLKFLNDEGYRSEISKQVKEFYRDPDVNAAAVEFFKLTGRDKQQ